VSCVRSGTPRAIAQYIGTLKVKTISADRGAVKAIELIAPGRGLRSSNLKSQSDASPPVIADFGEIGSRLNVTSAATRKRRRSGLTRTSHQTASDMTSRIEARPRKAEASLRAGMPVYHCGTEHRLNPEPEDNHRIQHNQGLPEECMSELE